MAEKCMIFVTSQNKAIFYNNEKWNVWQIPDSHCFDFQSKLKKKKIYLTFPKYNHIREYETIACMYDQVCEPKPQLPEEFQNKTNDRKFSASLF